MTMDLKVQPIQSMECEQWSGVEHPQNHSIEGQWCGPCIKCMQAPRYQKRVSRLNSWIMSWSRQEVTWSKEGHNVSHVIDTRQRNMMKVDQDQQEIRGRLKTAKENFSWTYQITQHWIWQYLTSKDLTSWWRGKEQMRGQKRLPKPMEAKMMKWDVPNPTRMQTSAMFKSDILPA